MNNEEKGKNFFVYVFVWIYFFYHISLMNFGES